MSLGDNFVFSEPDEQWSNLLTSKFNSSAWLLPAIPCKRPANNGDLVVQLTALGITFKAVANVEKNPDYVDNGKSPTEDNLEYIRTPLALLGINNLDMRNGSINLIPIFFTDDKATNRIILKKHIEWLFSEHRLNKIKMTLLKGDGHVSDPAMEVGFEIEGTLKQELFVDNKQMDVIILGKMNG